MGEDTLSEAEDSCKSGRGCPQNNGKQVPNLTVKNIDFVLRLGPLEIFLNS